MHAVGQTHGVPVTGSVDRLDERLARLTELFRSHASAVHNVAFRIVWQRADAEDVVQATFVQAFLHLGELRDGTRARPWLLSIAYRQSLTVLRRRREQPTEPGGLPDRADASPDPGAQVERAELAAMLRAAIDALPETLRTAFVLRDVEELSMADTAAVLGVGESAAKMRVARAREQLRRALAGRI